MFDTLHRTLNRTLDRSTYLDTLNRDKGRWSTTGCGYPHKTRKRLKYYITKLGQKVIATAMRLRETEIITTMSSPVPA